MWTWPDLRFTRSLKPRVALNFFQNQTRSISMALKHTRIEVNNAVFSLPYHVAKEKGFLADEGYDVELVPAGSGRDRDKEVPVTPIEDHRAVPSFGWHE